MSGASPAPGAFRASALMLLAALVATACSNGGTTAGTGNPGSGGGGAGGGGTGTGAGGSTAVSVGSGGATGAAGAAGSGGAAGGGGGTPADGGTLDGGGGGAGGATSCGAGRAVSLSANGTGTDSDAARARVVIDLMNDLPVRNASRTVELWAFIKTTDWLGERNEVYVYGSPGTATAFGLDFGTATAVGMPGNHATLNPYTNGGFNDDSATYLGITSTADQWVHVAMTWDGSAVRTYVNGTVRITTGPSDGGVTTLATASTPLTLGCNPPIFNCFNGYFDEVRVWNVARDAGQIMASYNKALVGNEPGLVGYWKFDEAPGATEAADAVTMPGHTAHPGVLMATIPATQLPTFLTPAIPVPLVCP